MTKKFANQCMKELVSMIPFSSSLTFKLDSFKGSHWIRINECDDIFTSVLIRYIVVFCDEYKFMFSIDIRDNRPTISIHLW